VHEERAKEKPVECTVHESFSRKIQGSILKRAKKGESRHAKQLNKEGSQLTINFFIYLWPSVF
jgi:hypothetical protein